MATLGRPAHLIRSEVVSKPGAAIEVTVFHFPAHTIKEQPMQVHRCRFSLKNIFRMIGQLLSQLFNCKLRTVPPSLPAPTVTINGGNSGGLDPSIQATPDGERDGNFLELYRGSLADMSDQVKLADLEISQFLLAYHDNLPAPGDYYYRARERNAASTVFSPYSAIVHYVAA